MTTLSVTLDDTVAAAVKSAANKQKTTVERLFVSFISNLANDEAESETSVEAAATARLVRTFQTLSRPLGGKGYSSRDELHER